MSASLTFSSCQRRLAGVGPPQTGPGILLTLIVCMLVASGCGFLPGVPATHIVVPAVPASTTPFPAPVALPDRVLIPRIGVDAHLIPLDLRPDHTIDVPDVHHPEVPGWFSRGVLPGVPGPAVLVGHVDGNGGRPGVFFRLATLRLGDEIRIVRLDGSVIVFRVSRVETMPKVAFATSEVYGDTDHPTLRLLTCGGAWQGKPRGYADNIAVLADLVP